MGTLIYGFVTKDNLFTIIQLLAYDTLGATREKTGPGADKESKVEAVRTHSGYQGQRKRVVIYFNLHQTKKTGWHTFL